MRICVQLPRGQRGSRHGAPFGCLHVSGLRVWRNTAHRPDDVAVRLPGQLNAIAALCSLGMVPDRHAALCPHSLAADLHGMGFNPIRPPFEATARAIRVALHAGVILAPITSLDGLARWNCRHRSAKRQTPRKAHSQTRAPRMASHGAMGQMGQAMASRQRICEFSIEGLLHSYEEKGTAHGDPFRCIKMTAVYSGGAAAARPTSPHKSQPKQ